MNCFGSFWVQLFTQHPVGSVVVGSFVFLAAVGAMTAPGVYGGGFYGWAYRFLRAFMPFFQALEQKRGITPPEIPPVVPGTIQVTESQTVTATPKS